ncbi:hypothetical protein [Algoriphagus sp.]|uniref:hypothetical protein n=1 Tax=Algoriphagus sp. TaxID=1872435 RepID=UPI003F6FC404
MKTLRLDISITDLKKSLRSLSNEDKKELYFFLENELTSDKVEEPSVIHYASEKSLAKDWLSKEEDEQWKGL